MRIVIVGGGIAGLAAAQALSGSGHEVLVLEGSGQIGGKLRLGTVAGHTVDLGAESLLVRRPEALDLIGAVGLDDSVVHPLTSSAGIWTRDAVRPMPPTILGIPTDLDALAASGIVAERPKSIALPAPTEDLSVAEFVRDRVGDDVLERLVEPLLGGVYAGLVDDLSLTAAAPQIAALGDDLLAGAAGVRRPATGGPVFAGLAGGIGRLPQAVATASGAEVRTRATVRQLTRVGAGWQLVVGPTTHAETIDADAVIVAAPAPAAARLLADAAPGAAFALAGIEYASMAIVTVAVSRSAFPVLPDGSGFLVPTVDGRAIKAATFSTSKWRWVADAAGEDTVVFRCSIGRAGEVAALQRSDADLVGLALADMHTAVGLDGDPVDAIVSRWGGALPQYNVGHLERIGTIEADIANVPGLEVCGAAYHGIGIPAVIASAQGAVARLLGAVGTMKP